MPRPLWKGAIAFGLVHVPVTLYAGAGASRLDLDLLDRRDYAPVGYQRVNKRTGEPVAPDDIVKGYEYEKGQYVVVSDEDFRQANVKATQTVELVGFVDAAGIPSYFYDTPYYLEPAKGGAKGYALLREVLRKSGRVGLGNVVIRSRQHLAVVIPVGAALVLNTLRFADEIRPMEELDVPGDNLKQLGISARELEMAARLVDDMSEDWKPEQFRDTYRDDLMARIHQKVEAGKTHEVSEAAGEEPAPGGEVVDLMSMLKRSLEARQPDKGEASRGRRKPAKESAGRRGTETRRRRSA